MEDTYRAEDFSKKPKRYILAEFPYPSGSGLHIGHAFTFTGTDVHSRYLRRKGYNVLCPIGWDAFGLPTENYAIRTGRKPQDVTKENTDTFRRQMKDLGLSFDWAREVNTTDPDYYRWTQWIFIKLYEKGLAYKKEMPINWCPSCKVGLANEEVINGNCERCGAETSRRRISQWVVKITDYADRLIEGLKHTDFIEKVKTAQINWIGRSEGARILFPIKGTEETLEVFTTRPDTLWGATFMVVAPEHAIVEQVKDNPAVNEHIQFANKKSDLERTDATREKTGVFTGLYAINPATKEEIPIWISDFVLASYGTGAIMSVPGHDERDHEFARKFGLEIRMVVKPDEDWDIQEAAYTGSEGHSVNSEPINGLPQKEALPKAIEWLVEKDLGDATVNYHLRDWIFSRQHYWGEPIPMIHCEKCGWQPVREEDLPIVLPDVEQYQPTDTGESPLANITDWVETTCPKCGGPAKRETDTMPNWAGSDWYFLRYTDPNNDKNLADMEKLKYWLPVDTYIGGDEHNTLHLLYSRFIYQFLFDLGVVPQDFPEPYKRRLSHGVILGPDGSRMSKSRGNVIVPDDIIKSYNTDTLRTYMMFIGPFDATMAWNERALQGVKRFLDKLERFVDANAGTDGKSDEKVRVILNKLGKQVGDDLEVFKFNTAVAKMMEAMNDLTADSVKASNASLRDLLVILSPFAPFMVRRLWEKVGEGKDVDEAAWPKFDKALAVEKTKEIAIQVNGKLRGVIEVPADADETLVVDTAKQDEGVTRHLENMQVIKTIFIKGRTLNFVVKPL